MQPNEIRGLIIDQIVAFNNGHLASAFSLVEILLSLYRGVLHHNPEDPGWPDRDRLILSKGHGCSALYAVLASCGYFPLEILYQGQEGSVLGGHPDRHKVPGIEFSTGSLGHGLAVAVGMALAAKKAEKGHHIYCILGDGELQEGSVWEAALFAAQHKLDNLTAIVDWNNFQSSGPVHEIIDLEPVFTKWQAFGWHVAYVDGHNCVALVNRLEGMKHGVQPQVCIATTQKGKGVSFFESDPKWHTTVPNVQEVMLAKRELGLPA